MQYLLRMAAHRRSDVSSCGVVGAGGWGGAMRNEPWVGPEVGDAGTSGAGAVPLRSAQMMGQKQRKEDNYVHFDVSFIVPDGKRRVNEGLAKRRNTQGTESVPSPALTQLIRN